MSDESEEKVSAWDLLGIAPDWTAFRTTDEYIDEERSRGKE